MFFLLCITAYTARPAAATTAAIKMIVFAETLAFVLAVSVEEEAGAEADAEAVETAVVVTEANWEGAATL